MWGGGVDLLFLADKSNTLFVQVVNDGLSTGQYGVEAVASEMNMSVQTFRRRLMSVTGESPKAFISAIQQGVLAEGQTVRLF